MVKQFRVLLAAGCLTVLLAPLANSQDSKKKVNDESDLPPARGEDERFSRADADLTKVHGESQGRQSAGAKIVIAHTGASGNEQGIPALGRMPLDFVDQQFQTVPAAALR